MAIPYPSPLYVDGRYDTATPVSLPEFSSPISGDPNEYVLEQKFVKSRNAWNSDGPLALNTPHPDYTDFILVEESPRRDIGGGIVEWIRKFAKVPDNLIDWESKDYSFIGLSGSTSLGTATPNRARQARVVNCKILYEYFLTGLGGSYAEAGDIPKIWAMQYCQQLIVDAAILGGITYPVESLNPASSSSQTYPTLEQYYNLMLPDAYANGWNATVTNEVIFTDYTFAGAPGSYTGHFAGAIDTSDPNNKLGGIIPVTDSILTRWLGNIYQRQSRYVLVQ